MKLERRNEAGPSEAPEEIPQTKRQKPVVVYIMILFIAAFLLMAWSFASHQRSNTEAMGQIQSSVSSLHEIQDLQNRVISLQSELAEARENIQDLETSAEQREGELESLQKRCEAMIRLQALEQMYAVQDFETCQKLLDSFEEDELVGCLDDSVSSSDRDLGISVSPRERYKELKAALDGQPAAE